MKVERGRWAGEIPREYLEGAKAILDYLKPQLNELSQIALADMGTDTSPAIATDWLDFTGRRPDPEVLTGSVRNTPKRSLLDAILGDDRSHDTND